MKKLVIALLALTAISAYSADINVETIREIDLTPSVVGALTNSATYTCPANRVAYPLGLYQSIATGQTNTCVLTQTMGSATTAVQVESLTAVGGTTAYETVGAGDVTADVDDIIVNAGETLTLTGTGADASNTVYVLKVKLVTQ